MEAIFTFTSKALVMLSIFLLCFSFPSMVLSTLNFEALPLPSPTTVGPESYAFDPNGVLYTGTCDGRVLKYGGPNVGFVDFSYTSPIRTKEFCDGKHDPELGHICGRPLGLGFNTETGDLYIADEYLGLFVVGPEGGLATLVANSSEGLDIQLADGLDVDPITQIVYFTDAGSFYSIRRNNGGSTSDDDESGRLLQYDPSTKQVTTLVSGLVGAAGAAVSLDGTFVIVPEYQGRRILKYWIKGPKANTTDVLWHVPGRPNNAKRTEFGHFWVAVNFEEDVLPFVPAGIKIDAYGTILDTLHVYPQYNTTLVNEVQEYNGSFYVGNIFTNFVGVYKP